MEEESLRYNHSFAVYQVHHASGYITLLDRMDLGISVVVWSVCPRVDHHSRRVFVPCWGNGVVVAHLDGERLVRERTLNSVLYAESVDAMSPDTVYVCDSRVHSVDINHDSITSTLEKPDTVRDEGCSTG